MPSKVKELPTMEKLNRMSEEELEELDLSYEEYKQIEEEYFARHKIDLARDWPLAFGPTAAQNP
jgi:hypothetical protein